MSTFQLMISADLANIKFEKQPMRTENGQNNK